MYREKQFPGGSQPENGVEARGVFMFHYGVHTERTNDLTLFAFALSNVLAQACFNLCLGHDNYSQQMPKNIYHIIVDAQS